MRIRRNFKMAAISIVLLITGGILIACGKELSKEEPTSEFQEESNFEKYKVTYYELNGYEIPVPDNYKVEKKNGLNCICDDTCVIEFIVEEARKEDLINATSEDLKGIINNMPFICDIEKPEYEYFETNVKKMFGYGYDKYNNKCECMIMLRPDKENMLIALFVQKPSNDMQHDYENDFYDMLEGIKD